ncbi:MAG: hypothetical protein A2745_00685 [Candidatus Harrisonbacteria bacterium RIFCSPHIGHO2_01_FULL_44_13]|uniref:SHS2 domain-containing protein n=1 Tax=Candidatus Harrisonbacteria bacterium RIFCSPLOWO2_01_FULL_44_18 TaxID=1798407 RepID=A0A1G1ZMH4_9BACT|nr:MAG: hypothetical protein A2745_00685 [Candidatus Harrisonbacteria bacterium RIFCSPHIGHO2_01_FULL_44_13]OGY65868.1 MAG: hypothetical protein A3A16_02285 [Candidatus Harrisonbacteria bacterium RIFCSPLOWO2_01_FULL_44_18]
MRLVNFKELFSNFLSLFQNEDRFLVVEILHHELRAASINADFANKEIFVKKVWQTPISLENNQNPLDAIRKFLLKIKNLSKYRIILSLDSSLATTVYSSSALVHQHTKEPIDEAELDNLISQAIWKFFDRQRNRVAVKMKISDVDVLLTDVRIRGIKLDGHRVINPLGFQAKSVEFYLSQTFAPRAFIKELKEFLPEDRLLFVTEAGAAWSNVLLKSEESGSFLLVNLFPEQTSLFHADDGRVCHWGHIGWGEKNLHSVLARHLAVSPETSSAIFKIYFENKGSPAFIKKIEKVLMEELRVLAKHLETATNKTDAKFVYLNSFYNLPPVVFSSGFRGVFDKPIRMDLASSDFFGEKLGIKVKFKKGLKMNNKFATLATLLESHLSPQNDKISRMARRRVRWLLP